MPHARVAGFSEGVQTSDSTSWTMVYPPGVKPGELLLVCAAADGNTSISSITGYVVANGQNTSTPVSMDFAKKIADGTETGTFTATMSASEQGCWRVYRIQRWEGTLGTNFVNSDANGGSVPCAGNTTGTDATAENQAMTPFNWAFTEETLLLIGNAIDGTEYGVSPPTDYYGSGITSGGSGGASLFTATYRATTLNATEFPGATTLSGAEDWISSSIAVRPGTLAGETSPVDIARGGTNITTAATSHAINVGSPAAGTLLIVKVRFAGAPGTITFTGYTQFATDASDASDDETRIYYRLADGAEGATDTLSTVNSIKLASIYFQITGAANPAVSAPQASSATVGTVANINPGSFSPTGGAKDWLLISMIGMDSETATATPPTAYSLTTAGANANSGTGGAVATNCMIWGYSRPASQVATEDPAAWTSTAPNSGVTAITVAVPPADTVVNLADVQPIHMGTGRQSGRGM